MTTTASAQQSAKILSAPEAQALVQEGKALLIDIRSPDEWRETGIADIAIPMTMHEPSFLENYTKLKADNPDKEIALICATGGRTRYVQQELQSRGLGATIDVSEGMMGNGADLGWIKRCLPVKKFEE